MGHAATSRLQEVLGSFQEPHLGLSLSAAGAVEQVQEQDGCIEVTLALGFAAGGYEAELRQALQDHLQANGISATLELKFLQRIRPFVGQPELRGLAHVANVIAVASGKGGVGKSTVAANIALALSQQGARVGLLDADIYGPSQPRMMGLAGERPTTRDGKTFDPPRGHGLPVMSIGFLIDEEQPMVWRGPMVTQALTQLLNDSNWGELDYLVVDMPPGTGDTQLTLAQRVPVSGAVIVTTPQDIALLDARKGLQMFRKVGIPVLGIVENMSVHHCPACGHESHLFGAGGGAAMATRYDVALLGELPLDGRIREHADGGTPMVVSEPDSAVARLYHQIARRTAGRLAAIAAQGGAALPTITVEEDE